MEREASLLRCSKLSCYTEFNRMVQAIARNGVAKSRPPALPGAKLTRGTSAEYLFYTTLASMLNDVISNNDSVSQNLELRQVYEWFCTNKPLITSSQTTPQHLKPKLVLSTQPFETSRPQTAPASLKPSCNRTGNLDSSSEKNLLHSPLSPSGFTSSYMTHLIPPSPHQPPQHLPPATTIGQPNQQSDSTITHIQMTRPTRSTHVRHLSMPCLIGRRPDRTLSAGSQGYNQKSHLSLVEVPNFTEKLPKSINPTTLLQLAPSVAAKMEWQKERLKSILCKRTATLHNPNSIHQTNSPAAISGNSKAKMEAATVETMEENTAEQSEDVTTSPIFQDHERRDLETQIVSVSVKVAATHKQPQSSIPKHSYPNTSTHLPSLTHTCGTHKAARQKTPVHIVNLSLSQDSAKLSPATRRCASTGLRRSSKKLASGFHCSRYNKPTCTLL